MHSLSLFILCHLLLVRDYCIGTFRVKQSPASLSILSIAPRYSKQTVRQSLPLNSNRLLLFLPFSSQARENRTSTYMSPRSCRHIYARAQQKRKSIPQITPLHWPTPSNPPNKTDKRLITRSKHGQMRYCGPLGKENVVQDGGRLRKTTNNRI